MSLDANTLWAGTSVKTAARSSVTTYACACNDNVTMNRLQVWPQHASCDKRLDRQQEGNRNRLYLQQWSDRERASAQQESRGSGERGQPTAEAVGLWLNRRTKPRQGRSNLATILFTSILFTLHLLGCQSTSLPTHWVIPASALSDEAPIHFRFPKPIEGYSGKVTKMHGGMRLGDGHSLADARGWFNVDVKNVTLGEDALDESVRNNVEFLYSSAFPLSWFELQSIDTTSSALKPEKPVEGFLVGYFTLKDSSVPLRARARLFLHRSASNQWCLDLCAEFELKQLREVFHISGPGGESEPAGNHMFFEVKTTLIPVAPHTYNELLGL